MKKKSRLKKPKGRLQLKKKLQPFLKSKFCRIIYMTIIKSEFSLALNQVATERGISVDDVLSSIELAIVAAYKKEYPEKIEEIKAIINKDTGGTKIFENDKDITPPGFGRIAAQTAKQVILQKIREAEKKTVAA